MKEVSNPKVAGQSSLLVVKIHKHYNKVDGMFRLGGFLPSKDAFMSMPARLTLEPKNPE